MTVSGETVTYNIEDKNKQKGTKRENSTKEVQQFLAKGIYIYLAKYILNQLSLFFCTVSFSFLFHIASSVVHT